MEAIVKPITWEGTSLDLRIGFTLFRAPMIGWLMISAMHMFIKQTLPQLIVRKLSAKENVYYAEPYKKSAIGNLFDAGRANYLSKANPQMLWHGEKGVRFIF